MLKLTPYLTLLFIVFFSYNSLLAQGNVILVDTNWNIQAAIDSAQAGDTVLVAPGIYTGVGNGVINYEGKSLVVKSASGPEETIVDGGYFIFTSNEDQNAILDGFTITNSIGSWAIYCNSSPIIKNCILEFNDGAGLFVSENSSALIENCIIRNNAYRGIDIKDGQTQNANAIIKNCLISENQALQSSNRLGAGIYCRGKSPLIINCTITNNITESSGGGVYHSEHYTNNGPLTMRNCIVWGNEADEYPSIFSQNYDITYSCIEGDLLGLGNIDLDPMFSDTLYHLSTVSPCVDAGNPTDDFSFEEQENGNRINMGRYGNTPDATEGVDDQPIIFNISPQEGPPDVETQVTITGSNFGSPQGKVFFGGEEATIVNWSSTSITCETPVHSSGIVAVEVETDLTDTDILTYSFTFTGPAIIHVPDDRPTIQSAIDFASDGDTVLVAPGTYSGPGNSIIKYWGKAIVVKSVSGPEETTIDGGYFIFTSNEDQNAILDGFTITNSIGSWAIYCYSSPIIKNCILEFNDGAGLFVSENSSALIENCIIRNNAYRGIDIEDGQTQNANAIIKNCLISENQALQSSNRLGAGIYCRGKSPLIINCTITNNITESSGGGVYHGDHNTNDGPLTMRNCIVWGNEADEYPSIFSQNYDITYSCIEGDLLGLGNIALDPIFSGNLYGLSTGSPCVDAGDPTDDFSFEEPENGSRINMGRYGNTPDATEGVGGQPIIGNISPQEGPPDVETQVTITGSNFGTSQGKVFFGDEEANVINWSPASITCETPVHPSGIVAVEVETDLLNTDILTYSYTFTGQVIIHVPNDRPTIQSAIDFASDGDTVIVAPGTYTGIGNRDIKYWGKSVVVKSEAGREYTIIDAEGHGQGFWFNSGEELNSVLDGFTVKNSHTAISCISSPLIKNCILEFNEGSGVYIANSSSSIIENCIIRHNSRAGVYIPWGQDQDANAVVKNCLITENEALSPNSVIAKGAGVYCDGKSPLFLNCSIINNLARLSGGGVYHNGVGSDSLTMRNCIVWGNEAQESSSIHSSNYNISYSCVEESFPGTGNISTNPIFEDYYGGDFYLHPSSPCINSGDPTDDYSIEPENNGDRINMGAFGNTTDATKTSNEQLVKIIDFSFELGCGSSTEVSLAGVNFGSVPGSLKLGNDDIPSNSIQYWSDTLVIFSATSNLIDDNDIWLFVDVSNYDSIPAEKTYSPFAEYVSGDVSGVWTADCPGIYILTGDITIPAGQTLEIQPGVQVLVDRSLAGLNAKITVEGTLNAFGNTDSTILFSTLPYQKSLGAWNGLVFQSGNTHFTYSIVEYAEIGILAKHSNVTIESCLIQQNKVAGVKWEGRQAHASGDLIKCEINNNLGWGIIVRAECFDDEGSARPNILGNVIENNQTGAIFVQAIGSGPSSWSLGSLNDYAYAEPTISRNIIQYNNGEAVKCFAEGDAVTGSLSTHRSWGHSSPVLENNIIAFNNKSIKAEEDNNLCFSNPIIINNTCYNNGPIALTAGDSSIITIVNSIFTSDQPSTIEYKGGGQTVVSYSYFDELQPGNGNISEVPQFFDPSSGDFRLFANSSGIDSGNNDEVNEDIDFIGNIRIADGNGDNDTIVDIGAIEYHLPTIISQPESIINACENENIQYLIAAEGPNLTYQWQKDGVDIPGANLDQLNLDNLSQSDNGSYVCIITDELGGAVTTQSSTLTVHSNPEPEVSSNGPVCEMDTLMLFSDGGEIYSWTGPAGFTSNEANPILNDVSNSMAGTYIVTVTDQLGCSAEESIEVEIITLPDVSFDSLDAVCFNHTPFEITGGMPLGGTYSGPGVTNSDQFDPAIAGVGNTDIVYTYMDTQTGCVNSAISSILVNDLPDPTISGDLEICEGNTTSLSVNDGILHEWSTGETTATISTDSAAIYSVTVTDDNGCADTDSAVVIVNALPDVELILVIDTFCINEPVSELSGGTPVNGDWEYSGPGVSNDQFDPSEAGLGVHTITYTFTDLVTGCSNYATQEVVVLDSTDSYCLTSTHSIVNNSKVQVFPNPSDGDFTILLENWTGKVNVQVFDIQGRTIYQMDSHDKKIQLNEMPKGILLLRLSNDNFSTTHRLIVQ